MQDLTSARIDEISKKELCSLKEKNGIDMLHSSPLRTASIENESLMFREILRSELHDYGALARRQIKHLSEAI